MEGAVGNFSNSTNDKNTLEALNHDERQRLIPVIVYLMLLSVIGSVGNAIVLHVYRKKYRTSNSKTFLLSLCVVDLFSCVFVIPLEIATVMDQFTFHDAQLCKASRFCNHVSATSSSCIIGLIAIERYRKVCKPFKWQISTNAGRYLCTIYITFGIVTSIPTLLIYGKKSSYIPQYGVTGRECSIDDSMSDSLLTTSHVLFGASLFFTDLTLVIVMYVLIAVSVLSNERAMPKQFRVNRDISPVSDSLKHHSERESIHATSSKQHAEDCQDLTKNKHGFGDISFKQSDIATSKFSNDDSTVAKCISHAPNNNIYTIQNNQMFSSSLYSEPPKDSLTNNEDAVKEHDLQTEHGISITNSVPKTKPILKRQSTRRASAHRSVLLMFFISLAFVLSYTPPMILIIYRKMDNSFVDNLTDTERAVYKFFIRTYFLNYAINPVIYCLFGAKFRNYCKELFCGRCKSK